MNVSAAARQITLCLMVVASGLACAPGPQDSRYAVRGIAYEVDHSNGVLHVRWEHPGLHPELRYYEWRFQAEGDAENAAVACPEAAAAGHCRQRPRRAPGVDLPLEAMGDATTGSPVTRILVFSVRPSYHRYDRKTGELRQVWNAPWESLRMVLPARRSS